MRFDPAILQELAVNIDVTGYLRIMEARHRATPTGMGYGQTRFASPTDSFTVLYAAQDLPTALAEKIVRARFQGKGGRILLEADIDELVVASMAERSSYSTFEPAAPAGWCPRTRCADARIRPDAGSAATLRGDGFRRHHLYVADHECRMRRALRPCGGRQPRSEMFSGSACAPWGARTRASVIERDLTQIGRTA